MNEVAWLTSLLPGPMLDYLVGKTSERKLRLFACAVARRVWHLLRYALPRNAIVCAERFAEGQGTAEEMATLLDQANGAAGGAPMFEQPAYQAAAFTLIESALESARSVCEQVRQQVVREAAYEVPPGHDEQRATQAASTAENRALADLVREVFGNPFRPVIVDPVWLRTGNGTAGSLAQLFYDENRLDELPILADALQDGGCANDALLCHLRQSGGHVRGCWALDALLGNE